MRNYKYMCIMIIIILFPTGIDWEHIHEEKPPSLLPYLPSNTKGEGGLRSDYNVSKILTK